MKIVSMGTNRSNSIGAFVAILAVFGLTIFVFGGFAEDLLSSEDGNLVVASGADEDQDRAPDNARGAEDADEFMPSALDGVLNQEETETLLGSRSVPDVGEPDVPDVGAGATTDSEPTDSPADDTAPTIDDTAPTIDTLAPEATETTAPTTIGREQATTSVTEIVADEQATPSSSEGLEGEQDDTATTDESSETPEDSREPPVETSGDDDPTPGDDADDGDDDEPLNTADDRLDQAMTEWFDPAYEVLHGSQDSELCAQLQNNRNENALFLGWKNAVEDEVLLEDLVGAESVYETALGFCVQELSEDIESELTAYTTIEPRTGPPSTW